MPEQLHDIVEFRGDRLFNGAVNIGWFGTDDIRTRAAADAFVFHGPAYHGVSQADVGVTHGHRLQDTASLARSIIRRCYGIEDQPFTLAIAGYGTGKSHFGLTLAALLSQSTEDIAEKVLTGIESADQTIGSETRAVLTEAQQACLVVALNGMQSFDLTTEVTRQILFQVKSADLDTRSLDELRPRFLQAANLIRMAATNADVVDELLTACNASNIDDILINLEQQDEVTYGKVHQVLASRSITIAALGGESIRDVIDVVCREYCGPGKPFRCLVFLFDEFGRYTEFATVRSHIAGSGVLQDLFEGIQANASTACFAGFIQFDLNAYVQRVAQEHRNEILRYVTRYQAANRVYLSINLETLIASLIEKKQPELLNQKFDNDATMEESDEIAGCIARWFPQSKNHRLWSDPEQFHSVVRKGCWPLSAYSIWFLFHLAAAGKHLQERSALALLGDTFERFQDCSIGQESSWCITPVDFWSDSLYHELITSEEGGQQGSITHAYASVDARHGARLNDDLKRLLRATVLASKMGLQASDRDDAVEALSELAGLDLSVANKGIRLLQDEYNVLEWDEAFKEFDILGDAVPRTQFLSFVRQRVASTYDEAGKAALFASKATTWCDLLSDLDCDFAEENRITTREWRYCGVTSNLDVLVMQVKLATDRWNGALTVDEPRGTVIYCYVEPNRDADVVAVDTGRLLRAAAKQAGVNALPILVVLLCDDEGTLGQSLAELAVLDETLSEEDRVRFGNLIPAHQEKTREVVRCQVESMIKRRLYITAFKDALDAKRLSRAGTELFSRIYKSVVTFPFDGFSTARGNAADSCQSLTIELLLAKLDYDTVLSKPIRDKNRAVSVLKEAWGIFAQNGNIRTRPSQPMIRSLTEKWDKQLTSGEQRLSLGPVIRELCSPPYGANIASAGLFLGVFVAARADRLSVVREGESYAVSQWVQDGMFRKKFVDIGALHNVDLVLLGDESSEWEVLLDEWEQTESHLGITACYKRAAELKCRIPVPPTLGYRKTHLDEQSHVSLKAINEMDRLQNDALSRVESGTERRDVGLIAWGASEISKLIKKMSEEKYLWTNHQIEEIKPAFERASQTIIQVFPDWLMRQAPDSETPTAAGKFEHKMLRLTGGNLLRLGLENLYKQLEARTKEVLRNIQTAADARQLIREVQLWLTSHGDATRFVRVAELRALRQVGKEYAAKLQGLSKRIQMPEIGEVRSSLSEMLKKMKEVEADIIKRASKLWKSKIRTIEELETLLGEVDAVTGAFEGCPNDLEDLQIMRRSLRLYEKDYQQLIDDRLSWSEFEALANDLRIEAQNLIGDEEPPWSPDEVINGFVTFISRNRKKVSGAWVEALEAEAGDLKNMSAADANRLHSRSNSPPAVLTKSDTQSLGKVVRAIESRLDALKIDWLVEKFNELPVAARRQFLELAESIVNRES